MNHGKNVDLIFPGKVCT